MMKKHLLILVLSGMILTPLSAQISFGLKAGLSPQVVPGTHYKIMNRQDPNWEFLFNTQRVKSSEQYGLMARLDKNTFWFMTEVMYRQQVTDYSVRYMASAQGVFGERAIIHTEKMSLLDIPVSAGVSLGMVEVFSGFNATFKLRHRSELDRIEGYTQSVPSLQYGWHTGIGFNFKSVTFDVRYQQTFTNYGAKRYVNGEELTLYNAPGRLVAMVGVRF